MTPGGTSLSWWEEKKLEEGEGSVDFKMVHKCENYNFQLDSLMAQWKGDISFN